MPDHDANPLKAIAAGVGLSPDEIRQFKQREAFWKRCNFLRLLAGPHRSLAADERESSCLRLTTAVGDS